jgi:cupin fold WbuC family metalloprotein
MENPADRNMKNVFRHESVYADVGWEWIERLKTTAINSPLRRARLCLHRSDEDALHEMIIALAHDCLFPPHRHPSKSESYHIIEGRLILIIFADDGAPIRSLLLTPPGQGGVVCFRLSASVFHAVLPLGESVVFHEATNGPFVKSDTVYAPWAPSEHLKLREFLEQAAIAGGTAAETVRSRVPVI